MLRVGLTGGLGSGKSAVAAMLTARGAHVIESDALARELMLHSGQGVFDAIVAQFGNHVVAPSGELDRAALARIAFTEGRVEDLNRIVHPAVIARQAEIADRIVAQDPLAIVVVESALLFETKHAGAGGWKSRFDCVILVTATQDTRIERYVQRTAPAAALAGKRDVLADEARQRMSHQLPDEEKIAMSDFVLQNDGTLGALEAQVDHLWPELQGRALRRTEGSSR